MSQEERSLSGLEALRFLCATSVLLWHYNHFFVVGQTHVHFTRELQPLYPFLKPFYEAGWLGVQVFWAISGFIFFWKYAQPLQSGSVSLWKFAALRFSRLYPLHFLTLLAVIPMVLIYRSRHGTDYIYQHNDWSHLVLQLLMASDWRGQNDWSFNGPIWSVSIEVMVYALFYTACRWLHWTRWWQVLVVIAATGALYASHRFEHPVVQCLFFFYLGALTQILHRELMRCSSAIRRGFWGAALSVWATASVVLADGRIRPMIYVAVVVPFVMILVLDFVQPRTNGGQRLLTHLGHTTYSSYLLNFPLQLLFMLLVGGQVDPHRLYSPVSLLTYLGVTFVLAAASYHRVEVPLQRFLRIRLRLQRP